MMTQRERLASGYLYTDMDEGMPEERLGKNAGV
jgi:galactoside O-acetyltransferase